MVRALMVVLTLCLSRSGRAEQTTWDLAVVPDDLVHSDQVYIRTPGSIDLSQLNFTALQDHVKHDEATYVDVAVFRDCDDPWEGCNWTSLGVGGASKARGKKYSFSCCTQRAVDLGACSKEKFGRMILNETSAYVGQRRYVVVPPENSATRLVLNGADEHRQNDTILLTGPAGTYVLLITNCNVDQGHTVQVTGPVVWKSWYGYLPANFFGLVVRNMVLFAAFVGLLFWYRHAMGTTSQEHRSPTDRLVFAAIALGTLELMLRLMGCAVWNVTGSPSLGISWCIASLRALKVGLSHGVLVLLSSGWGLIPMSATRSRILVAGASTLTVVFTVSSIASRKLESHVKHYGFFDPAPTEHELALMRRAALVGILPSIILIMYFVWIIVTILITICFLGKAATRRFSWEGVSVAFARQLQRRFMKLLGLVVLSLLISVVLLYMSRMTVRAETAHGLVTAREDFNYWILWMGIALLFRPCAHNAQEYDVVTLDNSDDGLELSPESGPSGTSISLNDTDVTSNLNEADERFEIS